MENGTPPVPSPAARDNLFPAGEVESNTRGRLEDSSGAVQDYIEKVEDIEANSEGPIDVGTAIADDVAVKLTLHEIAQAEQEEKVILRAI